MSQESQKRTCTPRVHAKFSHYINQSPATSSYALLGMSYKLSHALMSTLNLEVQATLPSRQPAHKGQNKERNTSLAQQGLIFSQIPKPTDKSILRGSSLAETCSAHFIGAPTLGATHPMCSIHTLKGAFLYDLLPLRNRQSQRKNLKTTTGKESRTNPTAVEAETGTLDAAVRAS